jgi:hypothetical protein
MLAISAAVLGCGAVAGSGPTRAIASIMGVPDARVEHGLTQEWRDLTERGRELRGELLQALFRMCGCYQGPGNTCHGIRVARIVSTLRDGTKLSDFELPPEDILPRQRSSDARDLQLRRLAVPISNEITAIRKWAELIDLHLGAASDTRVISKRLREALQLAVKTSLCPPDTRIDAVESLLKSFEDCRLSECRKAAVAAPDTVSEASLRRCMEIINAVDRGTVGIAEQVISVFDSFLSALTATVRTDLDIQGDADPRKVLKEFETVFGQLNKALSAIEGK